jgi:hypothetical protein
MAQSGVSIIDWLAGHADALNRGDPPAGDAGLAAACEQWLAVNGGGDKACEQRPEP